MAEGSKPVPDVKAVFRDNAAYLKAFQARSDLEHMFFDQFKAELTGVAQHLAKLYPDIKFEVVDVVVQKSLPTPRKVATLDTGYTEAVPSKAYRDRGGRCQEQMDDKQAMGGLSDMNQLRDDKTKVRQIQAEQHAVEPSGASLEEYKINKGTANHARK